MQKNSRWGSGMFLIISLNILPDLYKSLELPIKYLSWFVNDLIKLIMSLTTYFST